MAPITVQVSNGLLIGREGGMVHSAPQSSALLLVHSFFGDRFALLDCLVELRRNFHPW